MLTPVGGVTWIVNVTVVGFDGVVGTDGVMLIVGVATGMTVTEVDWLMTLPKVSVTLTTT